MVFSYENPIISGFYPDPSCIRVDDTFYMINSSFQFFPGLPIHRSKDLVNWELIGHAICRPSQLSLDNATTKVNNEARREIFTGGLYAPTIRYHRGKFYIVCTNLTGTTRMESNEDFQPQNFLLTSTDLTDPESFSDPVYFAFYGIDPSLLFDDDDKVYLQGSFINGYKKTPATVIRQAEIDVVTGELMSEVIDIWAGSGGKVPEGPHLYKKDGIYWLLIAEGGTHRGHMITMAKSKHVWGPYESYEDNPVLSGTANSIIQCVGHGELFQDTDGEWWACLLARREFGLSYPLGRETYLVPVTWPDAQFPQFDKVELCQSASGREVIHHRCIKHAVRNTVKLSSKHAVYLRTPDLTKYSQGDDEHSVILEGTASPLGSKARTTTYLGYRQTSLRSSCSIIINMKSLPRWGHCGLSVYKDSYRYASLDIDCENLTLSRAALYPGECFSYKNPTSLQGTSVIKLNIKSSVKSYIFSYEIFVHGRWLPHVALGEVACSSMSGDDFTGTVYGIYAFGCGARVTFTDFIIEQ